MVVRIRFATGRRVVKGQPKNQRAALALATLLTPAAFMAVVLALWKIAADRHWAGAFAIPSGLFSYWQFWLAAAAALQICSRILQRYGKRGNAAIS